MKRLSVLALVLGICALALGDEPPGRSPTPVVVELFTSEGCSSCPPADALLANLAASHVPGAQVIALSEHVDYWNRLGWADPYSSKQFSERQTGYAEALRKLNVYTPQMVVDGRAEFVGSDARRARKEIEKAARSPKAAVELRRDGGANRLRIRVVSLPSARREETADVLLAIVEDGITSDVRRGENAGRKLAHTAVVRWLEVVGALAPSNGAFDKRLEIETDPAWNRGRLRAIAFIQERGSRGILGAGQIGL